ncbi:MAG TPA: VrlD [Candidatus Hydrogenedentes bacterium]|nr:VrlD [Candidatus Hydrogenedentota bacterium]
MLVKRRGGMTEYIPTPKEKREALVRDHFTEVVELLHKRLVRLEQAFDLPEEDAEACASLLARIREEEQRTVLLNRELRSGDVSAVGQ